MPVPSARPTNRQINFQVCSTVDWNNGGVAFADMDEVVMMLSAVQAGTVDRVDAYLVNGTTPTLNLQVRINGSPVQWTGPTNDYAVPTTVNGIDAIGNNTFAAGNKISLYVNGAPTGSPDIMVVQVTMTLRDV